MARPRAERFFLKKMVLFGHITSGRAALPGDSTLCPQNAQVSPGKIKHFQDISCPIQIFESVHTYINTKH